MTAPPSDKTRVWEEMQKRASTRLHLDHDREGHGRPLSAIPGFFFFFIP